MSSLSREQTDVGQHSSRKCVWVGSSRCQTLIVMCWHIRWGQAGKKIRKSSLFLNICMCLYRGTFSCLLLADSLFLFSWASLCWTYQTGKGWEQELCPLGLSPAWPRSSYLIGIWPMGVWSKYPYSKLKCKFLDKKGEEYLWSVFHCMVR